MLPFVVLAVGVVGTAVATLWVGHVEERLRFAEFEVEAYEQELLVAEEFGEINAAVADLASLYEVSGDVSADQFARFVTPILDRQSALRALSWNPVVRAEERFAHEAAVRAEGFDDYVITEIGSDGQLVPAGDRDLYVVVAAIEPYLGNSAALGLDVFAEPQRREALERARDTGEFSVVLPLELVQADEPAVGALGFLPRYEPGADVGTVEGRRAGIVGYFVAIVDVGDFLDAALASAERSEVEVALAVRTASGEIETFFPPQGESESGPPAGLQSQSDVEWGGKQIVLQFDAGDGASFTRGVEPFIVLVAGIAISVLLAGYIRSLRDRALRQDLQRQVDERTEELLYTTNQLRAIVESEPECVKLLNAAGQLVEMNAAGLAMIEADTIDEVRGLNVYDLIDLDDRERFIELNDRVMAGESATLEFSITGLRGTRRRLETHAVPLYVTDGDQPQHLAITRDVTASRLAERQRVALEVQLRHSQKLKSVGVLAGGIAHDFNNLLQVIIGNIEIARESGEFRPRSLDAAATAASEAAKLCDQMLTYAGESRSDVRPVSLPAIVGSMVELLDASHSKKVELIVDIGADVGAIDGDDAQLGQVLMNLVTNAAEAIGDEPGTVSVAVRPVAPGAHPDDGVWFDTEPPDQPHVGLVVADTGSGIGPDVIEQIFDPFFTTKVYGRGLGLSSTIGIVQNHAGYVNVATAPGVGTTITVLFPVSASAPVDGGGPDIDEDARFDWTVLVADDDDQVRRLTADLLEGLGLRVITAADGEAAVELFNAHAADIDIAVLDVTMPKMNGPETLATMRLTRPDLPVIFCSGYAADVAVDSATATAFTGFVHKPFVRADVVDVLRVAEREGAGSSRATPMPSV